MLKAIEAMPSEGTIVDLSARDREANVGEPSRPLINPDRSACLIESPLQETGLAFERYAVGPQLCQPISLSSIEDGTGKCILHPVQRIRPAADGSLECDVDINCKDSGTGAGGISSKTASEVPAFDCFITAPASGQISFSANWQIDKSKIELITEDDNVLWPSSCYVHGKLLHSLVAFKKDLEWRLIYSGKATKLNTVAMATVDDKDTKTIKNKPFVFSATITKEPVARGDQLALRTAMAVHCYLYLDAAYGRARSYVKAKFTGFEISFS
jgi:hypothetical protein